MNRMPDPSADPLFDPRLADWLEGDPYQAPDATLEVVLAAFPSIKQRRAWRVPWRFRPMFSTPRFATAMAFFAIATFGLVSLRLASPGTPVSPAPSPSTHAVETVPFTSDVHGFDMQVPSSFTVRPATRAWQMSDATSDVSRALDTFIYEVPSGAYAVVNAFSVAVAPGTSLATWLETWCDHPADLCEGGAFRSLDGAVPITTADGHRGFSITKATSPGITLAVLLVSDRVYVVEAWHVTDVMIIRAFGRSEDLVAALVSTMTLRPGAAPPPASPAG